ncbi:ADP-ribosylglycohydrolase family protein [bacterium]|nr:MAG: ADP-ribosylglycohydrolase family protein [bacterium]
MQQPMDDGDRLRGALLGATLGEALARLEHNDAPGTATLEGRLRSGRWSLGPGMESALVAGEGGASGGGTDLSILRALPIALTGAFQPVELRDRVAALYANAPRETTEAAIAFALLVAALFDGDRLAALDEAAEAAPAAAGTAMRSAPLEDAAHLAAGVEPLRSLRAGVWSFYQAQDAVGALLIAARTGLGAACGGVCGALAGAWWGRRGIPEELAGKIEAGALDRLAGRLVKTLARGTYH